MKILILLSFIIACIEACWWKKEEPARPVQRRPVPARLPPVKTKMGKIISRMTHSPEYCNQSGQVQKCSIRDINYEIIGEVTI